MQGFVMLSRITVQGLFGEFDYDLILKDGPLTYIHAQNGNGKSTLMRLVCNLFQGNLEEVRTTPFQRLTLYFDNGSNVVNYFKDKPTALSLQAGLRLQWQ